MDKRTKGAWLLAHSKNLDHVSGPGALRLENISYAGKIGRLYNVLRRGSDEARATVIDAATVTNPATTSTRARFRGPQRDAKLKRVRSSALSTYVTILLALTIFLIGNSQMSMADTISRYIRKSFAADTVIVFVHGIMGDGVSTWTSENDSYWPRMLTEDHAFDGADIFVYSYPTAFWATLSIDELAENMRSVLIADGVSNYQKIVFLSHSMGGLVTRAYLLKNRKVAEHTFFAYFFSTPTTGSQIASIAQYLSSNPQFTKMRSLNAEDYLADLSRQWLAASFSFPSYCAYEKRATKGVSLVVNMGSAIALCNKPVDPIDADHIGIVKPTSQNSASYIAFKAAYTDPNLATYDHLEGNNITDQNSTQPPVNIGGGGNIVTFGQSGGQNVINQAPKPDLKTLNNDIRQNPDGSQTILILTEVVAPYPPGSLLIKAAAPHILDLDVIPQRTGMSINGQSGKRDGYAFTTLMSPFGKYMINVRTSKPEAVSVEYEFQ